jgi:hypothetical protein
VTVVERDTAPAPAPKPDRRAMHIADVVFGLAVAVTFVCYFVKSRNVVVNGDDWETLLHGVSFGDYFRPYQTNLSIVPIAVYSFVFNVFGFGTYWPLRFAEVASHMAIAVTVFMIVRSRWGSAVALVLGVTILWYPSALLTPSLFNHWLALIGCLVAGWALTLKPGRSDWIVAIALTFALASSAVGVAGAVGCVVYVALTKAPLRRWLAVGLPVGLFIVWWFTLSSDDHGQNAHLSVFERIRYVYDGVTYSFQLLAPGGRWLGIPLAILFVAAVVWQLRGGVRAAASAIAWTSAIIAWWVGLAFTRAGARTGSPDVFRYRVVTCGFAVLALLPMAKSARLRGLLTSRRALGVALVACAALVAINLPGIFDHVDIDAADYRLQSAKMVVLNMGPSVVADDTMVHFDLFTSMTARRYRKLVDKYGYVAGTNPEHPDAKLVQLTGIKPKNVERVSGDDVPQDCVAIGESKTVPRRRDFRMGANQFTTIVLQAPSTDVMVQIQAFEKDSWVTIGRLPAGSTATLELPILISSKTSWTLRADGACGVGLK